VSQSKCCIIPRVTQCAQDNAISTTTKYQWLSASVNKDQVFIKTNPNFHNNSTNSLPNFNLQVSINRFASGQEEGERNVRNLGKEVKRSNGYGVCRSIVFNGGCNNWVVATCPHQSIISLFSVASSPSSPLCSNFEDSLQEFLWYVYLRHFVEHLACKSFDVVPTFESCLIEGLLDLGIALLN